MTILKSVQATSKGGPLTKEMQIVNLVEELQYLQAHPTPQQILDEFDHYIYRATGFHPTGTNANAIDSTFYISDDNQLANLTNTGAVNLLVAPRNYPSSYQSMRLASLNGDDDYMGWVIGRKETNTHLTFLIAYVDLQPATGAKLALMTQTVDKTLTLPNDDTYTEDNMPAYVTSQTTLHSQIYPDLGASHNATPAKQGWLTPPWPNGMPVESVIQDGNVDIKWYHPQTKALLDHWVFSTTAMPELVDMEPCSGLMNCSQIEGRWYDYVTAFAAPDVYVFETNTIWRLNATTREYEDTGALDTPFLTRGRYGESTRTPVGHKVYRNGLSGVFEEVQYPVMAELTLKFTEPGIFQPVFYEPQGVEIDWGNGQTVEPEVIGHNLVRYHMAYEPGTYKVKIYGKTRTANLASAGLHTVDHWGEGTFLGIAFYYTGGPGDPNISSPNLVSVPMSLPRSVTTVANMFRYCSSFNQYLPWDYSNVVDAFEFLRGATIYNQPLDLTSAVNLEKVSGLVMSCRNFNSLIDLTGVKPKYFSYMLSGCTQYNQPITSFDFTEALELNSLFSNCHNLEINGLDLDIPKATMTNSMFGGCRKLRGRVYVRNSRNLRDASRMFSNCWLIEECPEIEYAGQLTHVTGIFQSCLALKTFVPFGTVEPANGLKDISSMVAYCRELNVPINLNTSQVTNMEFVFSGCHLYNQIVTFDVSKSVSFKGFFQECYAYDQPVDFRAAINVVNIQGMFSDCTSYNSLIQLSTSKVIYAAAFMKNCSSYTLPLPDLDFSNVETLASFIEGCTLYNHPIAYETPKLVDCMNMLTDCSSFNNTIALTTLTVTNMSYMLQGCSSYDTEFTLYTGQVTTFSHFMMGCSSYSKPLSLDTSRAINMARMLYMMPNLNQPLLFDTKNVTDMTEMLCGNSVFNQDLSGWCVTNIPTKPEGFDTDAVAWALPRPVWGTCPAG